MKYTHQELATLKLTTSQPHQQFQGVRSKLLPSQLELSDGQKKWGNSLLLLKKKEQTRPGGDGFHTSSLVSAVLQRGCIELGNIGSVKKARHCARLVLLTIYII